MEARWRAAGNATELGLAGGTTVCVSLPMSVADALTAEHDFLNRTLGSGVA